jgi:hypothetical protein
VQEAAARAYISELRSVGILTEEGKATQLAQRWRLDESYAGAVTDLIKASYPEGKNPPKTGQFSVAFNTEGLVDVAPPGDAERQKVVSWFQREGLGQGAAGNKAATYLLLSSPTPNEAPKAASKSSQGENSTPARPVRRRANSSSPMNDATKPQVPREGAKDSKSPPQGRSGEAFPLNVNVQIHISADAGTEQIESIFQAMRRYLYDAPAS